MSNVIKDIFLNQPSQKAVLTKVVRYLRYYPVDLGAMVYFLVRHNLSGLLQRDQSNQTFVRNLYQYFLGKPDCQTGIDFFTGQLDSGQVTRQNLLFSFLMLPASLEQKFFNTQGILSHHQARLELVQKALPTAERILDLGGASDNNPSGSLLGMGYPHQPKQIDIIDLPDEERLIKVESNHGMQFYQTPEGTEIHYHYTSMTNLSAFPEGTFDLVWSGQSIEHITPDEAAIVMAEVYRVLKPGAFFCLDTPNRRLTLLQVRQGFVHPEHKIEYVPLELAEQLTAAGFDVVDQKAVSPMPISDQTDRFNRLEFIDSTSLSDHPDDGYSFYLQCQKPMS
ncbi:methyltransferase domain-containing protein [filamentous cyanobacterium LEGE 11480]|uniref:Methyltransferase domain-containing protein n=1 Tax=Romeriopsis navalis LEGE 11480 TaxID=2777977 RepID=A0A928Z635_9CYAN|nr:methyltransferase domain-containing protein [Romeriopsis navalis]MBE9033409.1 methyltransferase domain-containing protein [Romeriopsis navalis LEGE 11480]